MLSYLKNFIVYISLYSWDMKALNFSKVNSYIITKNKY